MEQFWYIFCWTVFSITVTYILSFLIVVPVGITMENAIKGGREKSIINALKLGLRVNYTEAEMAKRLSAPCTYTLGGVIDEMVRSKIIIRTPVREPTPYWEITRHPQLR